MTDNTSVIYKSKSGEIEFSIQSDFWLTDITGLESQVEINATQSTLQVGQSIAGMSLKGKNMTFTGTLLGDTNINRKKLITTILPLEPAQIKFVNENDTLIIDGYASKTPYIEPGNGLQVFQFEFFAPHPYFKTANNKSYVLSGVTAMWQTPFLMQNNFYISKYTENSYIKITNLGNVAQAFTVDIYAQAQVINPIIHNVTQNTFIKINKVLEKGDRIFVSTHEDDKNAGNATVLTQSGQVKENAFRFIDAESDLDMLILPGDNIFMADAQQYKTNLICTLVTAGGEYHSI